MRVSFLRVVLLGLGFTGTLIAQAPAPKYPTPPASLGEEEEAQLAMSAAPAEVSSRADVYVLRNREFVKVRSGSNGCACMVGRDLHEGSRYPICYDQEGARTLLHRELMQTRLRAHGIAEANVELAINAAYNTGQLQRPTKGTLAYMMSPQQVLFSSPLESGVRIGAWAPHLMLVMPGVEPSQLGLGHDSKMGFIQVHANSGDLTELVVKVPTWSDGSAALPPGAVATPRR